MSELPRYPTRIIGRDRAIAAVAQLLEASALVTVAGPGGIGKTRLAAQIASAWESPSHFVDLSPLSDPRLVVTTVANAVGADLPEDGDPLRALALFLAHERMLLVLDNCEHLVDASSRLAHAVVTGCPNVRVLATSREALRAAGGAVYRLEPLDDSSAVALFEQRARHNGEVTFSAEDAALAAEICRRLDGIPLAIELAAARVPGMQLKTLLARLDERFRVLTSDRKAALARHQTLRALVDWSFELLSDDKRTVFCRLGVFSGSFDLGAACNVASDERIESRDVLDRLAALVDKSMVAVAEPVTPRYRLLESMRHYALRKLRESGDEERCRRAHAEFFSKVAEDAAARFGIESEESWHGRFEPDLDNFRSSLEWLLRADPRLGARTIGNLKDFWYHCNLISEGLSRSQAMLAALDVDDDEALFPVLIAVGSLAWRAGDFRYSLSAGERALEIAERFDDPAALAQARYITGWARFKLADEQRGLRELENAVETFAAQGQRLNELLASIDYAIALKRTDPERGHRLLKEAAETAGASGWPRTVARVEIGLGEYEFLTGNYAGACERVRRIIEARKTVRSGYSITVALGNLSSYLNLMGETAEARRTALETVELARTNGIRIAIAFALQNLALSIARDGHYRAAARMLGSVDGFVDSIGATREPTEKRVYETALELLREHLDAPALAEELVAGRSIAVEDAAAAVPVNEELIAAD